MKRLTSYVMLTSLSCLALGTTLAQPPEEIPPVYQYGQSGSGKVQSAAPNTVQVITIPPAQATPAQLNNIDITPPPALPVAKVADADEDDTLKGLTTTFGLGVVPLGFDSLNINQGDDLESSKYFFAFSPSVDFATKFLTTSGKKVDFGLNYTLIWREYYNKATTSRDFEHDVSAFVSTKWTDLISTKLDMFGLYFFKAGMDAGTDNAILVDTNGTVNFKMNDKVSAKIGYWNRYLMIPNSQVALNETNDVTDYFGDIDDFRRGGLFNDATYDATSNSYIDPYTGELVQLTGESEALWFLHNSAVVGTTIKPVKGTSMGIQYSYTFLTFSNSDNGIWTGHFIKPSISQDLPWKGGSLSLANELRLRKYDYARTAVDPTVARQNFRNRLTLSMNQGVNEFTTLNAYLRWELNGQNNDNYENIGSYYHMYLGASFAF